MSSAICWTNHSKAVHCQLSTTHSKLCSQPSAFEEKFWNSEIWVTIFYRKRRDACMGWDLLQSGEEDRRAMQMCINLHRNRIELGGLIDAVLHDAPSLKWKKWKRQMRHCQMSTLQNHPIEETFLGCILAPLYIQPLIVHCCSIFEVSLNENSAKEYLVPLTDGGCILPPYSLWCLFIF